MHTKDEAAKQKHLWHLESMQAITDAIGKSFDPDEVLVNVVASIRNIFNADRAWLLFPCDIEAEDWSVPVEVTNPAYPGAFAIGERTANDANSKELFREVLQADGPVVFCPMPEGLEWVEKFSIRSQLVMAIRPRYDRPWMLGMHQCSYERAWSEEERTLFKNIGARIEDLLSASQLHKELKRSEEKHRSLFENMAQGVVYQDANGRIISANPAAERILGLSVAEMQGCTSDDPRWQAIHEDGSAFSGETHPAMVALHTGQEVHNVVMGVFNPKEEQYRWIKISAIPQTHAGEDLPYQVFTTFDDITAAKQAEAALRESEDRFRRLVELSPDAILVHDRRGHLLFVNRAGAAMVGAASPDDLIGRQILSFVHEDSVEAVKTDIKHRLEQHGGGIGTELRLKRIDGSVFAGEVTASLLTFMGKPAVQVLVRDVSERKQVEERLYILAQALEQAGEGVLITDAEWRIEYVNPAFSAITGYTAEDVLGKDLSLLNSGSPDSGFYDAFRRILRQDRAWSGTITDQRKDGSRYPALISVAPIRNEHGRITHFVSIQQDMTEQEQLEAQLRQAQKMEALGTLVGGIAHDFNNMLAGILGHLYLAKKESQDRPHILKRLQGIERLSARAAEMIQHMLTFARKSQVEMKTFSLTTFLSEAVKLARLSIPENIELVRDFPREQMLVHGDAAQLQQALLNLLSNARDAVADCDHPRIRISLRRHNTAAEFCQRHPEMKPGTLACLSVEDNGCGIAGDILDNIFEPFFTTKETGKGTGLGLAMVYGCIARHGGAIEAESRPRHGTSLHIFLPLLEQPAAEADPEDEDVRRGQGHMLLLADDEAFIREVTREALENLGYQVLEAEDGEQAWQLFQQQADAIDAVILDLVMPRMGGLETARRMRGVKPDLPVLFATGYDPHGNSRDEQSLAGCLTIAKPFKIEALSNLLGNLLEDRSG